MNHNPQIPTAPSPPATPGGSTPLHPAARSTTIPRLLTFVFQLSSFIFLLSLTGCGYSSTPLYRQGIHTVAVPIFINKTYRREWEDRLTEALDKQIESRTPYKIADQKSADTVLSGTIVDIHPDTLTRRTGFNLPREIEYTVVIDFVWKDARNGRIIVERKNFNRSATDIPQIGESFTDAEQQAVERLAAAIVDQLQTDW